MDNIYVKVGLTILAGLLILHTITSNLMVIVAFRINKQLHTLKNYCLVSLAVSDLIVGILLMSVFTMYLYIGYWPLGAFLCDLWLSLDYGVCTASVLNLLVIAVDRLLSVSRPLTYRRTPTKMGLMIAAAWIVSGIIWAPWIFAWPYIDGVRTVSENECFVQVLVTNPIMATILSCCAFLIPVIVTTLLYCMLYRKNKQRKLRKKALQSAVISKDGHLDNAASNISQQKPTTEAGLILSFIQALCCCFFSQNNNASDIIENDKLDIDGITYQSRDSGIACCEKEFQKESLSREPQGTRDGLEGIAYCHSISDITCIAGVASSNDLKGQSAKSGTTKITVDAAVETGKLQDSIPSVDVIGEFDSAGLELENIASLQEDLNSQGLEPTIAARVRTIKAKRQQQYNDRRMVTILSATLLSLTISFAPYYITAIVESFSPGFLNVVAANVCKYAFNYSNVIFICIFWHL